MRVAAALSTLVTLTLLTAACHSAPAPANSVRDVPLDSVARVEERRFSPARSDSRSD